MSIKSNVCQLNQYRLYTSKTPFTSLNFFLHYREKILYTYSKFLQVLHLLSYIFQDPLVLPNQFNQDDLTSLELQIIEYFLKRYVSKIQKNIILCTCKYLLYFTSFIHFRLSKKNPSLDVDDDSTIQFGMSEPEGIANFVA